MNEVKKKSLYSWLLFDLANTVYAFVIPGLYFSVWLVRVNKAGQIKLWV